MGYGCYKFGDGVERGYAVDAVCDHPGCTKEIDRGFAYLCYNCMKYFCEPHLTLAYDPKTDEPIEFDCFIGRSPQCCESCKKKAEFPPVPDDLLKQYMQPAVVSLAKSIEKSLEFWHDPRKS
jgi:hypothetical protein